MTAAEVDAYAPPSSRIRTRTQTSFPSRVARCSAQILAGWRWTWPTKDSSPVVDDLHRTVRVEREHRPVDLHREILAPAERAADAGEVDAHLLGPQPQTRRDLVAIVVQPLRRDVDVDSALAVGAPPTRTPGPRNAWS